MEVEGLGCPLSVVYVELGLWKLNFHRFISSCWLFQSILGTICRIFAVHCYCVQHEAGIVAQLITETLHSDVDSLSQLEIKFTVISVENFLLFYPGSRNVDKIISRPPALFIF
ncbi:hypothetical protein GOODEAATRI_027902 [Goodea atripinnis]|uniref:Uncharacterized protein n=1 Tax=Goodea atripinnis TaxID=208336 RepID=A0ABV0MLA5_9TELE